MPKLTISGAASIDGASQPFDISFNETEFEADVEKQIMERFSETVVEGSVLTLSWSKSEDWKLSLPLSLPIIGKIITHPEILAAESLTIVLETA